MNIHQRIIGLCWLMFALLILPMTLLHLDDLATWKLTAGIAMGLLFLAAGLALLLKYRHAHFIALPCAVLSLITFPVGTPIGVYYFWYYFKREKPA